MANHVKNAKIELEEGDEMFTDYEDTCAVCGGTPVDPITQMCFRCYNNL